jgi:hypothetical protein
VKQRIILYQAAAVWAGRKCTWTAIGFYWCSSHHMMKLQLPFMLGHLPPISHWCQQSLLRACQLLLLHWHQPPDFPMQQQALILRPILPVLQRPDSSPYLWGSTSKYSTTGKRCYCYWCASWNSFLCASCHPYWCDSHHRSLVASRHGRATSRRFW